MDMRYQYLVERKNRREDVAPLFWVAVLVVCILVSSNVLAADAKLMIDVIECESSGIHDKRNGRHYGIAQFRKSTFYWFKRMGKFPKDYYYANPIHQMRVLIWALDNGYGSHWQCLPAMDAALKQGGNK